MEVRRAQHKQPAEKGAFVVSRGTAAGLEGAGWQVSLPGRRHIAALGFWRGFL